MIHYRDYVMTLIPYFDEITFNHIPREENQLANALATLAFMFKVTWLNEVPHIRIERLVEPFHCLAIEEEFDKIP